MVPGIELLGIESSYEFTTTEANGLFYTGET
jgi:hypothetical protein